MKCRESIRLIVVNEVPDHLLGRRRQIARLVAPAPQLRLDVHRHVALRDPSQMLDNPRHRTRHVARQDRRLNHQQRRR